MSSQIKIAALAIIAATLAISATVAPSSAQTRFNRNDQPQYGGLLQRIDKERGFGGESQIARTY